MSLSLIHIWAVRDKAYLQMDTDSETMLNAMESFGGYLPFGEKAEPDKIKRELKMSKNAFKRALGHLLKDCLLYTSRCV